MSTPISSLRNLGPATESALRRAGIPDAERLRALGADAAYAALLHAGERPHFIGYTALVMALQGRPWNDACGAENAALRGRFDALKAAHRPQHALDAIETILDQIGVVDSTRVSRRRGKGSDGGA